MDNLLTNVFQDLDFIALKSNLISNYTLAGLHNRTGYTIDYEVFCVHYQQSKYYSELRSHHINVHEIRRSLQIRFVVSRQINFQKLIHVDVKETHVPEICSRETNSINLA